MSNPNQDPSLSATPPQSPSSPPTTTFPKIFLKSFSIRPSAHFHSQLLMELTVLYREKYFIIAACILQIWHSIATNLVYYLENFYMTSAQRMPLFDVGFNWLPEISGAWWKLSDALIYIMMGSVLTLLLVSLKVNWVSSSFSSSSPNKPLWSAIALTRCMLTVCVLQQFRIISFLATLLPGPSHQCLYTPGPDMYEDPVKTFAYPFSDTSASNPAGNNVEWDPPTSLFDIIFRMDASTGCGDLMFSSHNTFAVVILMTTFYYLKSTLSKLFISICMAFLIPLTLMSRKHYSIDVFTALYVGPIVYELMYLKVS